MRRIDPVRLSVPVSLKNGPATQRGRGRVCDSQAFGHLVSPSNANSLTSTARNALRQAFSVHKVEKGDMMTRDHTDSFSTTDNMQSISIDGQGIVRMQKRNQNI